MKHLAILLSFLAFTGSLSADPALSSWFTQNSTQYARVYKSRADEMAQLASTTWSQGAGVQTVPVYADINAVAHSATYVYVLTSGLSSHIMGPWYFNTAQTTVFANWPDNQRRIYRIPRTPAPYVGTARTKTSAGITGIFVNGVALFDMTDTFSYDTASGYDGTTPDQNDPNGPSNPATVTVTQDAIWNRDAYVNEKETFDPTYTHQAGANYHYHATPVGLRHQLGDSVDYNATTNRYTESFNGKHSPILGWARDGYPIYGPYGYSDPTNASSSVRRMISGFQKRDGTNSTTNLAVTGRRTLPAWAATIQGRSAALASTQYGPNVNAQINWDVYEQAFETAVLGRYLEDYDFKGNLAALNFYEGVAIDGAFNAATHYDLNLYNGRICVTPEYPSGIFAYFVTIESDGTPAYPYIMGREYYGVTSGGAVTSVTETVTEHFSVANTFKESMQSMAVGANNVTLVWNALEGGTYTVASSTTLNNDWVNLSTTAAPTRNDLVVADNVGTSTVDKKFYRITRTALAASESIGTLGGGGGTGANASHVFTFTGNLPPNANVITGVTVGGVAGTVTAYTAVAGSSASVTVSFSNTTLTSGQSYTAILSVTGPPPGNAPLTFTSTNTYTKP
jgi:YHYH protein